MKFPSLAVLSMTKISSIWHFHFCMDKSYSELTTCFTTYQLMHILHEERNNQTIEQSIKKIMQKVPFRCQLHVAGNNNIAWYFFHFLEHADEWHFKLIEYYISQDCTQYHHQNIISKGLVHDCSNSIANALELLQSCTKPSTCSQLSNFYIETVDRIKEQNLLEYVTNSAGRWLLTKWFDFRSWLGSATLYPDDYNQISNGNFGGHNSPHK